MRSPADVRRVRGDRRRAVPPRLLRADLGHPGCSTGSTDLPRARRLAFLDDMERLGEAVQTVCARRDSGFRRVNLEILGNTDAFLHAHVWPRYEWEGAAVAAKPVWLYPATHWSEPTTQTVLGPRHDDLRAELTAELARLDGIHRAHDGPHPRRRQVRLRAVRESDAQLVSDGAGKPDIERNYGHLVRDPTDDRPTRPSPGSTTSAAATARRSGSSRSTGKRLALPSCTPCAEVDRKARFAIGMFAPRFLGRGFGADATRLVLRHRLRTTSACTGSTCACWTSTHRRHRVLPAVTGSSRKGESGTAACWTVAGTTTSSWASSNPSSASSSCVPDLDQD